jgi:hypothetical protein
VDRIVQVDQNEEGQGHTDERQGREVENLNFVSGRLFGAYVGTHCEKLPEEQEEMCGEELWDILCGNDTNGVVRLRDSKFFVSYITAVGLTGGSSGLASCPSMYT